MISRREFLQFAAAASVGLKPEPANDLDSVIQYTSIPVYKEEVVISASSGELLSFPFVFMTGHKLVRFSSAERENRGASPTRAACCSPTTAITTSTASTRR